MQKVIGVLKSKVALRIPQQYSCPYLNIMGEKKISMWDLRTPNFHLPLAHWNPQLSNLILGMFINWTWWWADKNLQDALKNDCKLKSVILTSGLQIRQGWGAVLETLSVGLWCQSGLFEIIPRCSLWLFFFFFFYIDICIDDAKQQWVTVLAPQP